MATYLKRGILIVLLMAGVSPIAFADIRFQNWDDPDAVPWAESKYTIPAYPKDASSLIEFYVSATATNKYFVDASSLSVTEDGVVRYVLVVKTSGGATNISFEGMHCDTRDLRVYAVGRTDGTWYEIPNSKWKSMQNNSLTMHQSILGRNFICPNFVPIFTAKEGVDALKRGRHPSVPGDP